MLETALVFPSELESAVAFGQERTLSGHRGTGSADLLREDYSVEFRFDFASGTTFLSGLKPSGPNAARTVSAT